MYLFEFFLIVRIIYIFYYIWSDHFTTIYKYLYKIVSNNIKDFLNSKIISYHDFMSDYIQNVIEKKNTDNIQNTNNFDNGDDLDNGYDLDNGDNGEDIQKPSNNVNNLKGINYMDKLQNINNTTCKKSPNLVKQINYNNMIKIIENATLDVTNIIKNILNSHRMKNADKNNSTNDYNTTNGYNTHGVRDVIKSHNFNLLSENKNHLLINNMSPKYLDIINKKINESEIIPIVENLSLDETNYLANELRETTVNLINNLKTKDNNLFNKYLEILLGLKENVCNDSFEIDNSDNFDMTDMSNVSDMSDMSDVSDMIDKSYESDKSNELDESTKSDESKESDESTKSDKFKIYKILGMSDTSKCSNKLKYSKYLKYKNLMDNLDMYYGDKNSGDKNSEDKNFTEINSSDIDNYKNESCLNLINKTDNFNNVCILNYLNSSTLNQNNISKMIEIIDNIKL